MGMLLYPLRGLEQMAVAEWLRSLLKIDTGKWYCVCCGAISIKVQRGPLSICEKLINTKVIFIRSQVIITSRD